MQSTVYTTYSTTPFGVDAYRQSIRSASLDRAEEAQIVEAARAGELAARDQLIGLCMQRALRRAVGLATFYRSLRGVTLDPQDIAQEAVLRVLVRLDKALAAANPIGYLLRSIEGAMLTYCRERQTAVRVPASMQSKRKIQPPEVLSLDAPFGDSGFTLADLIPS